MPNTLIHAACENTHALCRVEKKESSEEDHTRMLRRYYALFDLRAGKSTEEDRTFMLLAKTPMLYLI